MKRKKHERLVREAVTKALTIQGENHARAARADRAAEQQDQERKDLELISVGLIPVHVLRDQAVASPLIERQGGGLGSRVETSITVTYFGYSKAREAALNAVTIPDDTPF